jgi:hypothetical protein
LLPLSIGASVIARAVKHLQEIPTGLPAATSAAPAMIATSGTAAGRCAAGHIHGLACHRIGRDLGPVPVLSSERASARSILRKARPWPSRLLIVRSANVLQTRVSRYPGCEWDNRPRQPPRPRTTASLARVPGRTGQDASGPVLTMLASTAPHRIAQKR